MSHPSSACPSSVRIVEVGPRDGLQNEPRNVPVATRIELVEALAEAGLRDIEVGSFVSPRWVPQMAGAAEVFAGLRRRSGISYSALVPNDQGLAAARQAGVTEISIFAAASESFSRRNINCGIDESLDRLSAVARQAVGEGMRVRGYVSCVLGCPYEGRIDPEAVASVSRALMRMGCHEISLGDTIGVGTPLLARRLVERIARDVPVGKLAVHFHDTHGQALANILACLDLGVATIDAAVAGLGGCPYARGATGNVATEDVVYMLEGLGIEHGVDIDRLCRAGALISSALGRETSSRAARARGQG